ncbi:MAG: flagellar hook-associated protein FlgK [Alphaproteobacteria bacterium]|nr:flagellar hook-associated protein FlgK [Alphaproteobacteria bacterium]MBP7758758.1 flagellar hook-associated protein FlgK [Alphaproteobacteria bacterium]MBP7761786.1 flagellar hook-associated protein FlgK [Alphaproteobacteria bacterium]MBP7903729.1 flagellar hook-associated protein FlgK [Alphaproteobacteria bacterium]
MGLSGLDAALSGLKIYQKQIETISANVSNVGTEGYTRKILPQAAQSVGGQTVGVLARTVIRNVDINLERDLWTQVSAVGFYDVQKTYLERIDQFHGEPGAGISVAAEVTKLHESFVALADTPEDRFLRADVVDQAADTANKINELSDYITTLRNDAQSEAEVVVQSINDLLEQIAELNQQVRYAMAAGNTSAAMEDSRDLAIKELSSLIEISLFRRGDGVLVVQTVEGAELVGEQPNLLTFDPSPLSANNAYPATAAGVFVGDPNTDPSALDITARTVGGRLGGLLQLRDEIFPKQMAQIDELAHKLALRFEAQGLRLFTDSSGGIPSDNPPDTGVSPADPVDYVGFSALIQVNGRIVNDHSLLQKGTYGAAPPPGSNEIIRRVLEFTFSGTEFQEAINQVEATSVDIRAAATGATTLQNWLGLRSSNQLAGSVDLTAYSSIADLVNTGGTNVFGIGGAETDRFIIRFDDPDFGGGPYDIEIDLRTVAVSGSGAVQDLINHITADADWANAVADYGASVSAGADGELLIQSRGNIQTLASGTEPLSDTGFAFLGLKPELKEATDPYFDVSVGNNAAVRITIEPTDTETDLLAKLNAVPGLVAQTDANGFLSLRPGGSFVSPDFGGDIKLVGGPFETDTAALAGTAAGRASINDGVNIVSALFGTYSVLSGGAINDESPIVDVPYTSETENGTGSFVHFRSEFLGPGANIESEVVGALTLEDYAQKMVNQHGQELNLIKERRADEETLQGLLEKELVDSSGVNLDEELGFLIVVQTAYAASARVINAIDEIFQELLRVV